MVKNYHYFFINKEKGRYFTVSTFKFDFGEAYGMIYATFCLVYDDFLVACTQYTCILRCHVM